MSTSFDRVTITKKGLELQKQLRREPDPDTSIYPSARCYPYERQVPSQDFSASGSSSCRTGYFRPKHATHAILKNQHSSRLYPNYMKRDPREYPSKHECSWEPPSTTVPQTKPELIRPVTKTIHHSFYNPHVSAERSANPTVKEANLLVSGPHGHLTMNLTTCNYPESKLPSQREEIGIVQEYSNMSSPTYQNLVKEASPEKKPMTEFSTPFQTPRQMLPKSVSSLKLPIQDLINLPGLDARPSMNRVQSNLPSQARLSQVHSQSFRPVVKMTDEKMDLVRKKFDGQQRAYDELLVKLNEKIQAKYEKDQECPNYLTSFDQTLRKAGSNLEDMSMMNHNLATRYNQRLREHGEKRFGKSWKRWDRLMSHIPKEQPSTWATGGSQITSARMNDSGSFYNKKNTVLYGIPDKVAEDPIAKKIKARVTLKPRNNLSKMASQKF